VSLPRLQAPDADGAMMAHPPLADLDQQFDRNRLLLSTSDVRIGGMRLAELRTGAAREAVAAAHDYLRSAGEPVPDVVGDSLVVAGHQPELFHPGVWLKHFALNAIARRAGRVPLNLVVDNDTAKAATIRLPAIGPGNDPAAVHLLTVPFDHFAGEVAFEERKVEDEGLFADFPRAVGERTAGWPFEPILPAFWRDVVRRGERTALLGERLVAGRRAWERRWGCHNPELPISRLCKTEAFARFAVGLLDRLPDFHAAYNESARDYRRRHRIRSPNHPVPDLQRDGDWLEAPFWAWRAGGQRRGRLFVRQVAGGWRLRVGDEAWPDLSRDRAVADWRRLERDGFKVRTRALTTTLFTRLCLADLFVHGIGGGKYDELTDAIIARHFGLTPPTFLVLTGTLRLPLPTFPATADDERAARRLVRDIHWNPQRHLSHDGMEPVGLARAKEDLASSPDAAPPREHFENTRRVFEGFGMPVPESVRRVERFVEFRRLTEQLRPFVADVERGCRERAARLSAEAAANAVLRRRDYAFGLFPESTLRPFLTRFTSSGR
jgi:hypothetical protein